MVHQVDFMSVLFPKRPFPPKLYDEVILPIVARDLSEGITETYQIAVVV